MRAKLKVIMEWRRDHRLEDDLICTNTRFMWRVLPGVVVPLRYHVHHGGAYSPFVRTRSLDAWVDGAWNPLPVTDYPV